MISKIIKEDLNNYIGEYESFIDIAPDIYERLEKELHKSITVFDHHTICAALAFGVSPLPFLPKEEYGAYHYTMHIIVGGMALLGLGIQEINNINILKSIQKAMETLNENEITILINFIKESTENLFVLL